MSPLDRALALVDDVVAADERRPVRPWMWGPALFGYALAELEGYLGEPRYRDWLVRYGEHYLAHPPAIHSSDTVAPALITDYLARVTGDARYDALTRRVVDYIRRAPRLAGDAVNHLGDSGWTWLYPRSVWVDSLVMFSLFPALWGTAHDDAELVELAAAQPSRYAALMQDDSGLWYHAWWAPTRRRPGRAFPGRGLFWGRGNGWVVTALPLLLDALGPDHPRRADIVELIARTSAALRPLQRADGSFGTLLRDGRGDRELSASALIAHGWLRAVRRGHLDGSYRRPAAAALAAVESGLRRGADGWELTEISGPTIPLPVLPRLGYTAIPRGANHPYGIAAYVLAAIEFQRATGR